MWGRGLAQLLSGFQSLPPLPTSKLGLPGAESQVGGFVYILGPWWVSPTNSPLRLGVSPTTATPIGFYSQRFWGFNSPLWNSGLHCLSVYPVVPPSLSAHECRISWSISHHLTCQVCQLLPCCMSSPSPSSHIHPSYQSGWMFLLYLFGCRTSTDFDFLAVPVVFCFWIGRYPSFGWVKKRSISTYASILAGSQITVFLNLQLAVSNILFLRNTE